MKQENIFLVGMAVGFVMASIGSDAQHKKERQHTDSLVKLQAQRARRMYLMALQGYPPHRIAECWEMNEAYIEQVTGTKITWVEKGRK